MTPLIIIQLMGLLYVYRTKKAAAMEAAKPAEAITISAEDAGTIIEFEEEHSDE
jgi:hypothetical protein